MDEHRVRLGNGSVVPKVEPVGPAGEPAPPGGPLAAPPPPGPAAWGSKRRRRRRPFGVYAIVALFLLQSLAYGLLVAAAWEGQSTITLWERTVALVWGSLLGLLTLSIVVGLLLLRRAALVAAIILQGASLALSIWGYFHDNTSLVGLALGAATVFYLNQRQVQAAFRRDGSARGGPLVPSGADDGSGFGRALPPTPSGGPEGE